MTLRPLLEGAQDWRPPANTAALYGTTHFAMRADERGIRSIPGHLLLWVVAEALRQDRTDLVAPVFLMSEASRAWRILLPEGCFYPVVRLGGCLVTIYTQAQIKNVRHARRQRKRMTGKRARFVVGGVAGHEW